jgi:DNA polymerase III delta subunit
MRSMVIANANTNQNQLRKMGKKIEKKTRRLSKTERFVHLVSGVVTEIFLVTNPVAIEIVARRVDTNFFKIASELY